MNSIETQNNKTVGLEEGIDSLEECEPAEILQQRLEEIGLSGDRFISVEYTDGHKKPTQKGWKTTQYPAKEIDGPAGVVCGNGLVVVDSDIHKPGVTAPNSFEELPDTFTVSSMHGGTHRYYKTDSNPQSSSKGFGDIQSTDRMVVAPGSEFAHSECDRDKCQLDGTGEYPIRSNAPIVTISTENHPDIFGINTNINRTDTPSVQVENTEFGGDIDSRLSFAAEHDKKFNNLWTSIKKSETASDNSARETALAQKLMFYLEGDESKVRQVMDEIHPPKWSNRSDSYRDSVIKSARKFTTDIDVVFEPNTSSNGGSSSVVQHNAIEIILTVRYQMDSEFTTKDVSEIQRSVGSQQTIKVLRNLEGAGYLKSVGQNKGHHWKKVTKIPDHGKFYQLLVNQYKDLGEVKQIQHRYLQQQ